MVFGANDQQIVGPANYIAPLSEMCFYFFLGPTEGI